MKRKAVFRRLLACLLCAVLCAALAGCGGASGSGDAAGSGKGPGVGKAPDGGIRVEEDTGNTGLSAPPALPTDVENNGGDYVRVERKVYFRCYGPDALGKTAAFGAFTDSWNCTGGEARILSYDLDSGAVADVLADAGYGPLYYGDGGFYLQERAGSRNRIVWHSLDGTQSEPLCGGTILGITPGGLLAVLWDSGQKPAPADSPDQYRLYRNTALTASMDLAEGELFAGVTEDGLFYLREIFIETEAETGAAWTVRHPVRTVWQMQTDGTQIQLGVLPELEDDYAISAEIDGFVPARGQVGIDVGYYAGTAHALQAGLSFSAVPGQADSLKELTVPEEKQEEEAEDGYDLRFRLEADPAGDLYFVRSRKDEVRVNWESGDLEHFDGWSWQTLVPGFAAQPADGRGFHRILQSARWLDGAAFVTLACSHAAPAENVGWRDAYTLLHMQYLRVTADGEAEELACVDHEAVLCGMAWFVEGEEALLWQERGDGWNEVNSVYRIPIAPGAEWDGGREAILAHASWAALTELDHASYYGYSLPENGTEELLYLRLNRDGEAEFLTETAPDALLSIQMGMPESELDGAAEVVNVQRRPSDEDTPWYWAKLTALQDGVDLRLERTPDEAPGGKGMEYYAIMEGVFVPGYTIAHRVLNKGEYVAVRASLPWYPETRVSVGKGGTWGAYVFGEDNYLHLENEDGSIPEKIVAGSVLPDLSEYGGVPDALIHGGSWFCYDDANHQTALAAVAFGLEGREEQEQDSAGYGNLEVTAAVSDEEVHRFYAMWDRLYAGAWDLPDILRFYTMDAPMDGEGTPASSGDYRVDIYRTDGLELLRLTQMNNGDGILSKLIPGAEDRMAFTLARWRGVGEPGAKLRNTVCPAVVVREVPDGIGVWMREAEQVDVREDGSPVYMPIPGAPCLPYVYSVEAAVPEGDWPMQMCLVSVDRDGVVQEIEKAA